LPVLAKKEKTREVLVDTNDGKGEFYKHPANTSFDNPITAVHHAPSGSWCLKFETSDGVVGVHPAHTKDFERLVINPPGAAISMIKVWVDPN